MTKEPSASYQPNDIEKKWAQFWEEKGYFGADPSSSKPAFSIIMPPPNVTGVLHMGHALVNTLQDILIRWKRMKGYEALWVPGTDHAGISTQTVVERHLISTTGKRRKDFSREEFLTHVWDWKEKSETQIISQLKRLGCSCDWSRLAFSMDAPRRRAVRTCFKKMFDHGFIYRGDYLVNWDPQTETAIADDEVEYEERQGFLYYLRYPVENSTESLIVATTRPETMLGDTAVAVHPKDERYQHLIGKKIILPITQREVPIIADRFVDPTFGSGAVKITPAHDPNDYEMALRHELPFINIMTPDGKINEQGGEFQGLSMKEARVALIAKLQTLKVVEQIIPHSHRVGISYRSKADIEPYLSKQWFVKTTLFKERLIEIVKKGEIKLIPPHWESTYFHWIEHLRDWCISRQLWWGHRIPVWYNKNSKEMICEADEEVPLKVQADPENWIQDEDVLDTWFSSSLWPFSVFNWPDQTADLKKFFPTTTLITGHDILFFWVARMIMMSDYTLATIPFSEAFLHGLVYGKSYWRFTKEGSLTYVTGEERVGYELGKSPSADIHNKWEKMSKSKGNIIDPIDIIETYGTDAMRLALAAITTHARQIDLDLRRFEECKHFVNKIWNGARFVFMNLEGLSHESLTKGLNLDLLSLEDRWILSLLNRTIANVDRHLQNYAFDHATALIYEFFWNQFCAYYVELSKPILFGKSGSSIEKENKQKLLLVVLCAAIRLMHPIAPFVTEELFQQLKEKFPSITPLPNADPYTRESLNALQSTACIVAPYPQVIREEDINSEIEERFTFMDQILHTIRTIRAEMQLPPSTLISLYISSEDDPQLKIAKDNQMILSAMTRLKDIYFNVQPPVGVSAEGLVHNLKIIVPLPEELKKKEKTRLIKEEAKLIAQQNGLREQLANEGFVQKAPPPLVEKLRANLALSEKNLLDIAKKLQEMRSN